MSRLGLLLFPLLGALALSPAALGGQPATQALTPAPPPFYSCKAVGDGTICEADNAGSYADVDTGIVCGAGAGAFDIYDAGTYQIHAVRWYDADGRLVRRIVHGVYSAGAFSNPLTGAVVDYTQDNTTTDVLAVPGDFASATTTNVGENVYRDAAGRIVFRSVGRFVTAPDGSVEFRSGVQNFLDLFVDGDVSVLEPLCAALGAS